MDEEKMMPYFRDSAKPEDYWNENQWKMVEAMREMDILPASDAGVMPGQAAKPGGMMMDGLGASGSETREAGVASLAMPGAGPDSRKAGQDSRKAGQDARWETMAKNLDWDLKPPSADRDFDTIAGIGSLFDGMKQETLPRFSAGKVGRTAGRPLVVQASAKPVQAVMEPAGGDNGGDAVYQADVSARDDVGRQRNESYAAGLRFDGRNNEDAAQAIADWMEKPVVRAMAYGGQAFMEGVVGLGGKAVDPPVHAWNVGRANFKPTEHLSPEEIERIKKENANIVKSVEEAMAKSNGNLSALIERDTGVHVDGNSILTGRMAKTANLIPQAVADAFGRGVWQIFSNFSDTVSAGLKTYRSRMLEYQNWTDKAVCDPVANPLFGDFCQRHIRAGGDPREIAMITRRNMATFHALKAAGIQIGEDRVKKWLANAVGHSGERALVRMGQNLGMDLVIEQAKQIGEQYGEAAAARVKAVGDAINEANEWHMTHF